MAQPPTTPPKRPRIARNFKKRSDFMFEGWDPVPTLTHLCAVVCAKHLKPVRRVTFNKGTEDEYTKKALLSECLPLGMASFIRLSEAREECGIVVTIRRIYRGRGSYDDPVDPPHCLYTRLCVILCEKKIISVYYGTNRVIPMAKKLIAMDFLNYYHDSAEE